MKKLLTIITLLAVGCLQSMAYNQVRLVVKDGTTNQQLKEKIERGVSVVMTEINRSQEKNLED